ncbi:hypothetical protein ACSS6W_007348 [Trichoderma asperelloides]
MQFSALILSVSATLIAAATATGNMNREVDSGCRAFEDPDCGIDHGVCQCSNGWFYELNLDNIDDGNYCNPPWGFLSTNASGLAGYTC